MTPARPGRRRFLKIAGVTVVVGGSGWGANWLSVYSDHQISNVGKLKFRNRLRVPELLDPKPSGDGRKQYTLKLAEGTSELLPGKKTKTWGANGPYLAPTIRARRGDKVSMTVHNGLPDATTLHWHGMHLPPAMDGGPHQMIERDGTWKPQWTVHQPACTLWYHPHPHGSTAGHVYRGIAGMIILDDEHSTGAPLPSRYGVDDLPLVIQDKNFHDDGSLDFGESSFFDTIAGMDPLGILGDTIIVNGTYDPYFHVTTTRVRLRLLNGSNARVYQLGFPDERTFHLVAAENGLLPRPRPLTRLQLGPGERAEIVVECKPGEQAVLRSFAPDLGIGFPTDRFHGGDDTFDILALRAAKTLRPSPALPTRFAGAPAPIKVPNDAKVRKFHFVGTQINGKSMDINRVDEVVAAGATEIWEIDRGDGTLHSFHVHGATFNVLDVDGEQPPEEARGPKDTVYLPESGKVRLAVRFDTLTDDRVPYMYHCHVLRHEDDGMMGQFLVVAPDAVDRAPRTIEGSHGGSGHH
ncbi:multicopper oxidase domain-containing protein [Streptomyces sp. NPDC050147]|uniref:multicopper oxidase family protein n=1 Tax=Streptomyces sp. NPDC050147 TaxID=3155513 RepID=UPI0034212E6D